MLGLYFKNKVLEAYSTDIEKDQATTSFLL